ncbi:SUMO-activating enzyme subunit 2-like [Oncorhynchus masou masou]|uniref:SUMO-activating enzyme subunit 2-like n=1 Tax=Oncorhynchus masou masou TaxID=90313 RepID=UPI0031841324
MWSLRWWVTPLTKPQPHPAAQEDKNVANGNKESAEPSTSSNAPAEQDDVLIVDSDEPSSSTMDVRMESGGHKRKLHDAETGKASAKRQRLDQLYSWISFVGYTQPCLRMINQAIVWREPAGSHPKLSVWKKRGHNATPVVVSD